MGFRSSMGTYLRKAGLQTLQMILALAYVLCQLLVTWLQFQIMMTKLKFSNTDDQPLLSPVLSKEW